MKLSAMKPILKKITQSRQSPLFVALFMGHLVFATVLGFRALGFFQGLELTSYDLMLWTRSISVPADQRITMVWATDEDQRTWGWPLSDEHLASLIATIETYEPRVIALNIYRDLPVPRVTGHGYEYLLSQFKQHDNIFGVKKYKSETGVHVDPPPLLDEKGQVGFNDLSADSRGIFRRGLLFVSDDIGNVYAFYGLLMALKYLAQEGITPEAHPDDERYMVLGKTVLKPLEPDFGGYVKGDMGGFQMMLNYPAAPRGFKDVSITRVLTGRFNPDDFKDKIVIIGVNAEATPDFLYTPFGYWENVDQRVPAAAVHAYSISQLLRMAEGKSQPMDTWNESQEVAWIWMWTLLGALVCLWARSVLRFTLSLVGGLMLLVSMSYIGFSSNYWILVAAPTFGWISSIAVMISYLSNQEKNQRAELMHLFSKHVSKDVAEIIWKEREEYLTEGRLRSQRLIATLLFTDLQNFTTVSERMEPQELMDWLNQYMETMVNVVEKQYSGQVNKFIGDAIMAIFGVPIPRTELSLVHQDAINSVECALAMRTEIEKLRDIWQTEGMPLIRMRVGICTGPVVAGSLGGIERQEYTVLGDTVNTASRLESFDKSIDTDEPCRILISQTTLDCLGDRFETECVGSVSLKGKEVKVTIHRVIGFKKPQIDLDDL
ncbi:adenylate/guanylate cyclase domain-containing protein [Candidatus Albibeggiatoa sp. nov. BB20]|uniref:CHASE2 domain-containing protein n=1 Tax=Candidatus Albibeggiatoa sp. nov. BB20 TaxID=3162723 RepID=UPI0033653775